MKQHARALAAAIWLGVLSHAARSADALVPGADLADCRSALRVGLAACEETQSSATRRAQETAGASNGTAAAPDLEQRVDAYLSAYGKPPREAVRALLDPSDAHIRDLLRKQEETLAIASYVAARMTQLHDAQAPQPATGRGDTVHDLETIEQMRVRLIGDPHGDRFPDALQALRRLARNLPGIRAGVVLVGSFPPQALRNEIARIDPMLSVDVMASDAIDPDTLPLFRIDDLRNRRSVAIAAQAVTARQLSDTIVGLRRETPGSPAAAPFAQSPEVTP